MPIGREFCGYKIIPHMKKLLQLESLALLAAGIFICMQQPYTLPWYAWILLFLAPDLGMIGYVFGPASGAFLYNLFHHQALAIGLLLAGWLIPMPALVLAGALLLAHSAFDRALGYGLKHPQGFRFTHLGNIGPSPKA